MNNQYRIMPVDPTPAIKDAIRESGCPMPETMWAAIIARHDLVSGPRVPVQHDSDCSTNNRGVPSLLGPCDCMAKQAPIQSEQHVAYFYQESEFGPWIECGGNEPGCIRFTSAPPPPVAPANALTDAECALALNLANVETDAWADCLGIALTSNEIDGFLVRSLLAHLTRKG